jgi:hypothetical protein
MMNSSGQTPSLPKFGGRIQVAPAIRKEKHGVAENPQYASTMLRTRPEPQPDLTVLAK